MSKKETSSAWSVRMAQAMMQRHPSTSAKWRYQAGVALTAIQHVWLKTGEQTYFDYIKHNIDAFVTPAGEIRTYKLKEYNLDQINQGKLLFPLYAETGDERYKKAAYLLRRQLQEHPRTSERGFWHKLIYPHQMWLDGVYMAGPFLAQFAQTFDEPQDFDEVAHQIKLVQSHTLDTQTGLLYHGWDESKRQKWADSQSGCSPHFWGRALGWYTLAMVDVLDFMPQEHPRRDEILEILRRTAAAVAAVQDESSGLWYQVLDQGNRAGNYLEASASCMFVYAMSKGARKGYIAPAYLDTAKKGYQGILERLVTVDEQGLLNLAGICHVAGLGGEPYRDGSYEYYVSEPVVSNDFKGVGPFIMASVEMERHTDE